MKPQDWSSEYLRQCEDCEQRSNLMTEWECSFIDSLQSRLARGIRPSPSQIEVLDRIWEKVTDRG